MGCGRGWEGVGVEINNYTGNTWSPEILECNILCNGKSISSQMSIFSSAAASPELALEQKDPPTDLVIHPRSESKNFT